MALLPPLQAAQGMSRALTRDAAATTAARPLDHYRLSPQRRCLVTPSANQIYSERRILDTFMVYLDSFWIIFSSILMYFGCFLEHLWVCFEQTVDQGRSDWPFDFASFDFRRVAPYASFDFALPRYAQDRPFDFRRVAPYAQDRRNSTLFSYGTKPWRLCTITSTRTSALVSHASCSNRGGAIGSG